jgi:hypothetical protein
LSDFRIFGVGATRREWIPRHDATEINYRLNFGANGIGGIRALDR